MQRRFKLIPAIALLTCGAAPLHAQTSPEEAQKLQAAYETYLGKPGIITIAPDGDAYRAQLDPKKLFAPFNAYGVSLDAGLMTWTVKRQADGSLLETLDQVPDMHWRTPVETADQHFEDVHGTEVLDAALPWIREAQGTAGKMVEDVVLAPATGAKLQLHTEASQLQFRQSASVESSGIVTNVIDRQTGPIHVHEVISSAVTPKPLDITMDAEKSSGTTKITGLQAQKLLDIWAWLVAHPSRDAIAAQQAELKDLIRKALPLFVRSDRASALDHVKIATAYGTFNAAQATFGLAVDGLAANGVTRAQIELHDVSVGKGALPAWAGNLTPKEVSIEATLSGYDAPKAADVLLDRADFAAPQVLSPEAHAQVWKALLPQGQAKLVLGPNHLKSALLDLDIEGTLNIAAGLPTGSLTLKAKGVEALLKAMSAGPQDHLAQQIMLGLILAKGYAQVQGDGTLVWHVVLAPDNITVNGNRLKGFAPPKPQFKF